MAYNGKRTPGEGIQSNPMRQKINRKPGEGIDSVPDGGKTPGGAEKGGRGEKTTTSMRGGKK